MHSLGKTSVQGSIFFEGLEDTTSLCMSLSSNGFSSDPQSPLLQFQLLAPLHSFIETLPHVFRPEALPRKSQLVQQEFLY